MHFGLDIYIELLLFGTQLYGITQLGNYEEIEAVLLLPLLDISIHSIGVQEELVHPFIRKRT